MKKGKEPAGDSGGQDLTLALLVANSAAAFVLYALVKISKRKYFPTLEAIRKVYSGIMRPDDYRE